MSCNTCAKQSEAAVGTVGVTSPQTQAAWATPDHCPKCGAFITPGQPCKQCVESSAQGETDTLKKNVEREKMEATAREAVLQAVVDDLCEQHEYQVDMEAVGYRGSYPSKFPEWERAWKRAGEVRYCVSDSDACALLERMTKLEAQVEEAAAREAAMIRVLDDIDAQVVYTDDWSSNDWSILRETVTNARNNPSASASALLERLVELETQVTNLRAVLQSALVPLETANNVPRCWSSTGQAAALVEKAVVILRGRE